MSRGTLLDLFCGAGGAAVGYARAGFRVVGVDLAPQPHYPFAFIRTDALAFLRDYGAAFDLIHASPPCQPHVKGLASVNRSLGRISRHVDLIGPLRPLLEATGRPWVIENVPGAPLRDPVRLCGSSFGLAVRRHRLFECTFPVAPLPCAHHLQREPRYWTSWRPSGEVRLATVVQVYGNAGGWREWPAAMGIDWMDRKELVEAVPPAYTEYIGRAWELVG